jgi:hypothetical protein
VAQVPETIQNPGKPIEVQEYARLVSRSINGDLSFGDPVDSLGDSGSGSGNNGRRDNMNGHHVRVELVAANFYVAGVSAGVAVAFDHNLNLSTNGTVVLGPVFPNVIWWRDGTTTDSVHGPIDLVYRQGDAIGANSISLRPICVGAAPTSCVMVVWFQGVTPW